MNGFEKSSQDSKDGAREKISNEVRYFLKIAVEGPWNDHETDLVFKLLCILIEMEYVEMIRDLIGVICAQASDAVVCDTDKVNVLLSALKISPTANWNDPYSPIVGV